MLSPVEFLGNPEINKDYLLALQAIVSLRILNFCGENKIQ
jgi:hypothetical protein